jgi:hypothetical protein
VLHGWEDNCLARGRVTIQAASNHIAAPAIRIPEVAEREQELRAKDEAKPRMAERVCQFFLRGRCQRVKCEFRHPADQPAAGRGERPARQGGPASDTPCKFFLSSGCKFGTTCHFRHVGRERRRSRFALQIAYLFALQT